jgi:hypothetical protein
MSTAIQFQKATKARLKARIALIGPPGSGKTMTALKIAKGFGGNVAVIDTENGTASVYSDEFAFDVLRLETFSPETYVEAIHAAEDARYNVLVIDSLSHAWMGKEGVLEIVDREAARAHGNTFGAGWKAATPKHNALVDALVRCKCHLIVTMRSKTEYVIEKDERTGKSIPRKVGMGAVQRDGLEYEFDVVGLMNADNDLIVDKSRMKALSGQVFKKPGPELGRQILAWLQEDGTDTVPTPVPSSELRRAETLRPLGEIESGGNPEQSCEPRRSSTSPAGSPVPPPTAPAQGGHVAQAPAPPEKVSVVDYAHAVLGNPPASHKELQQALARLHWTEAKALFTATRLFQRPLALEDLTPQERGALIAEIEGLAMSQASTGRR